MYGKTYAPESTGTTFKAELNQDIIMSFFGLKQMNKPKYQGPVLEVDWADAEGSTINETKFPLSTNPEDYKDYWEKYANKERVKSPAEEMKKQFGDFNSWVKHVVCAYTSHEKWDEKMNQLPPGATFEQFVNTAASLLPQNYQQHKGTLRVGYKKGNEYLCVPEKMYMGRFWKLNEDKREDRDLPGENKYFKFTPFPSRDEQRQQQESTGSAPAQNQGETNW